MKKSSTIPTASSWLSQSNPKAASRATRREFLKTAGVGALGVGALVIGAPHILLAQDKSGTKNPVVGIGNGEYTYEVIHDWCTPPSNIVFGNTHGVCEDAQGRIYIKHTVHASSQSDDAIVVFDPDGKFIRSWGKEYKSGAHGLHINKEGKDEFLYLCDFLHNIVVKTTLAGEVVWTLKVPMESGVYNNAGEFKPTNVAVAPNGDVYVSDGYGKSWIHIYRQRDGKPEYVRTFGGPGAERGQVSCPHGLMIDPRGKEPMLVVADRSNHRLQYFTLDGRHTSFVKDELKSPCHFHERNGVLLIPDLEARVTLFDKDNKLIAHLGDGGNFGLRDKPRDQFIPGKFIAPHSAIFDHNGNIFVVEWVEVGRVTKLRKVS